jgi:hypothetical protein
MAEERAMPNNQGTSSRAAEVAVKKLKQEPVNVAGGAEMIEDGKGKVREGEAQKANGNGDDAIEEKALTGLDAAEKVAP